MKAPGILIILLFGLVSPLFADWDCRYLTLDGLMDASSLIVVAEIKSIEEKIENEKELAMEKVTQQIVFSTITHLKGKTPSAKFSYHASYIPGLCRQPESHYLDSPPGTKYLLFLTKKGDSYQSVLGPCGALKVSGNDVVFWYTDESKPQRYSEHWKGKLLKEVVARIQKKVVQDDKMSLKPSPVEHLQKLWRDDLSKRDAFKPHAKLLSQQIFENDRIVVRKTTGEKAFGRIDGTLMPGERTLILTGDLHELRKQPKLTEVHNPGTMGSGFSAYFAPDGTLLLLWMIPEG